MKNIKDETIDLFSKHLLDLAKKIHTETGNKVLIGYSMSDGEEMVEDVKTAGGDDFSFVCKAVSGITHYVLDAYGNDQLENLTK